MAKILLYYKYVTISHPQEIVAWQKALCAALDLKGRILIAKEGINGTLGGSADSLEIYKKTMLAHPLFKKIDFKENDGDIAYFPRLRVVERNEIVTMGVDPEKITAQQSGKHLTPRQAHKFLQSKPDDLVILDTRNQVESAIGTFKDAITPPLQHFRDYPAFIDQNLDTFKNKQVFMFCTGGVRCERASAYLKSKGVTKEVYQLEGGIHRYIEQFPDGFFRGKNYVFDGRIAVKANDDILGKCALCPAACDEYNNCLNADCNKHFICCDACVVKYNYTCGSTCFELVKNNQVRLRPLYRKTSINASNELREKTIMNTQTTSHQQQPSPRLIQENIPLKDKNWFQTGGPARYFAEPTNAQEFAQALDFARTQQLPIFVLGQGANILISDEGFDGLVIRPQLTQITHVIHNDEVLVHAGAGVTMDALIEYCLTHNILGLEEFSGIPGTVGGSVYINLHYFQFLLEQFLLDAQVINHLDSTVKNVTPAWFNFGYNQSTLLAQEYYLISATFRLKKATDLEVAFARGRRVEIIRHRAARYPNKNTCGSFFRNFYPEEVAEFIAGTDKKLIFVAYYLDKIGVKGVLSVGDAVVSHQHANMLVNKGNATSTDLITLARTMQELVQKQFGIVPQPECQLVGFKECPLL